MEIFLEKESKKMNFKQKVEQLWHTKRPDIKSFAELERQLGFGHGLIQTWQKAQPNMKNVQKIADFFHVPVQDLIREEDSNKISARQILTADEQKIINIYHYHTDGLPADEKEKYIKALNLQMEALDTMLLGVTSVKVTDENGDDITNKYS